MSSITKNQKCEKQGIPYRELRRNGYNIGFVFLLRKSNLAAKRGTNICKQCRASYFIISCVVPKNAARVITTVALTIMDYNSHNVWMGRNGKCANFYNRYKQYTTHDLNMNRERGLTRLKKGNNSSLWQYYFGFQRKKYLVNKFC